VSDTVCSKAHLLCGRHATAMWPRTFCGCRYSHTATNVGREMVVTHGYFYDHTGGGAATWIDDTWGFNFDTEVWRRIDHPTSGPSATTAKPHARMSHSAVATIGGEVVLYGGDDGKILLCRVSAGRLPHHRRSG
jgi:hypothetical protein